VSLEHSPARQTGAGRARAQRETFHPHLTTEELAARWRCTIFTISAKYRGLGLRPIRVGKRLLFPMEQVEAAEQRSMGTA
jgi:hypothetical protein